MSVCRSVCLSVSFSLSSLCFVYFLFSTLFLSPFVYLLFRGVARWGGVGWGGGLHPLSQKPSPPLSPPPQMKWHFVQGSMESCYFELRSAPHFEKSGYASAPFYCSVSSYCLHLFLSNKNFCAQKHSYKSDQIHSYSRCYISFPSTILHKSNWQIPSYMHFSSILYHDVQLHFISLTNSNLGNYRNSCIKCHKTCSLAPSIHHLHKQRYHGTRWTF